MTHLSQRAARWLRTIRDETDRPNGRDVGTPINIIPDKIVRRLVDRGLAQRIPGRRARKPDRLIITDEGRKALLPTPAI